MGDIFSLIERNEDIPTLPVIMAKLLQTIDDERSSAHDLKVIMENDPAMTSRVLKIANSAFYGLRYPVESLQRAIVVLGFEAVRMLALSTAVLDLFTAKKQLAFDPEDFWLHSLGAAKSAQLLAELVKTGTSPETLFTAGLLHDIGKLCLAMTFKERYKTIVQTAFQKGESLEHIEMTYLSITYSHVNEWFCKKWYLPETISYPITFQIRPDDLNNKYRIETYIIILSSDLAREQNYGFAGDAQPLRVEEYFYDKLGVEDRGKLNLIREQLQLHLPKVREFLSDFKNI